MPTVINTNLASLYAQNNLSNAQNSLANSVMRLSSGLRINGAKDDAAGLAISQSMQTQINGVNQSRRNLNDATNLIQVADTSMGTIHDMLLRMKTLTTQGYDGSLSASQRTQIVDEINELNTEINATAARTKFNRNNLIAATASASMALGTQDASIQAMRIGTTATIAGVPVTVTTVFGTVTSVNANTNAFGTFTLNNVSGSILAINGITSSTYGGVTTSATYAQTLTMTDGVSTASSYQTINFDQVGISLEALIGRTEYAEITIGAAGLAAGQSLSIGGLTLSVVAGSADVITQAEIGAFFSNQSDGSTGGTSPSGVQGTNWTKSGSLSGWSSGVYNSTNNKIIFTSTTAYSDVTDIIVSDTHNILTEDYSTDGGAVNSSGTNIAAGLHGKVITINANSPADLVFQGGADTSTPNMITYDAINVRTDATSATGGFQPMMNLGGQVNILNSYTTATAQTAWATAFSTLGTFVDAAVDLVSEQRSVMGALQNRISYINQNLEAYSTNLQSSRSAIMDADFAAETAKLTKGQILQQAATAMLAQANQMPNIVLSLLK
jgi:flagellin